MKKLTFGFTAILVLSSLSAFAQDATPSPSATPFEANPDTIRQQILSSNLTLENETIQVATAKGEVNQARANLLPSLNVGAVISGLTSSPTFLLGAVQSLIPFVFPSNWINLKEEQNLFQAQIISYQILELNTYASALALYYTVLSDQQMAQVYAQEAKDYQQVSAILQQESEVLQDVSPVRLEQAQAQALLAEGEASHLRELSDQEMTSLQAAFSLPATTSITFDASVVAPSDWETKNVQDVINQSVSIAPEIKQTNWLVAAANNAKWSAFFNFFGSATIGVSSSSSSGGGFNSSDLKITGSVTIGANTFTQLQLSSLNIEAIQFQVQETQNQLSQVIASSLLSVQEAAQQYSLAAQAEQELNDVYQSALNQYQQFGSGSLTDLITARMNVSTASTTRIQAEQDLNLLRTTLNRALLLDEFGKIQNCTPNLDSVRNPTIDQLCQSDSTNSSGDNSDNSSSDDSTPKKKGWLGRIFGG